MTFLLPYILLPIALMFIWNIWKLPSKGLSFLITIVLLVLYPSVIFRIDACLHPRAIEGGQCLMFDTFVTIGHFVIMIPLSLILQLILFAVFVREKVVKE